MRRVLLIGLLAGCGSSDDRGSKRSDSGLTEATIAPPVACPAGDLLLSQAQIDRDLALTQAWNDLRSSGGTCDTATMDSTNQLVVDESLLWTARCWALDVSTNGAPSGAVFSTGETVDQAATAQGFRGFLTGWGVAGDTDTPEEALTNWVNGGGDGCTRLFEDYGVGAMAASEAGGLLVVTRLSGFPEG